MCYFSHVLSLSFVDSKSEPVRLKRLSMSRPLITLLCNLGVRRFCVGCVCLRLRCFVFCFILLSSCNHPKTCAVSLLRDVAWADLFCTRDLVRCLRLVECFLSDLNVLSPKSNLYALRSLSIVLCGLGVVVFDSTLDMVFVALLTIYSTSKSFACLQLCAVDR